MYVMDTEGRKHAIPKRRQRRAAQGKGFQPIHGSRKPFKRAVALTKQIDAASKIEDRAERLLAIAMLPVLRSRGHGGKYRTKQRTIFGRNMVDRSVY